MNAHPTVGWQTARRVKPGGRPVGGLRLDAETVDWFKGDDPKGTTARMAAVLRAFVEGQRGR